MARFKIRHDNPDPVWKYTILDAARDKWVGFARTHDEAIAVAEEAAELLPASLKLVDRRDASCVKDWPAAADGEYNPACCRFPKSCSAGFYARDWILDGTEATA